MDKIFDPLRRLLCVPPCGEAQMDEKFERHKDFCDEDFCDDLIEICEGHR